MDPINSTVLSVLMVSALFMFYWNLTAMTSRKRPWDYYETRGNMWLITGIAMVSVLIFDIAYDRFPNPDKGDFWMWKNACLFSWIMGISGTMSILAGICEFILGKIEEKQIQDILKACQRH